MLRNLSDFNLKEEFDKMDADGSGAIDLKELTNLFSGDEKTAADVLALIEAEGEGKADGKITFEELKTAMEKMQSITFFLTQREKLLLPL